MDEAEIPRTPLDEDAVEPILLQDGIPPREKPDIPEPGSELTQRDLQTIFQAVIDRQEKNPDEELTLTLALVLMNVGNRFSKVECIEQEWTGLIKDIPMPEQGEAPKCPNGHGIVRLNKLVLGWIEV